MRPVVGPKDPAPSRMAYKAQRFILSPIYRRLIRIGLPVGALFFATGVVVTNPQHQEQLHDAMTHMREHIETRPEFMVNFLTIEGARDDLASEIRAIFPYDLPASTFEMDLAFLKDSIRALPAVEDVDLSLTKSGRLEARVTERRPVLLWHLEDSLWQIDQHGVKLKQVEPLLSNITLPVVAGEGADAALPEAMELFATASPMSDHIQALVRIGARRWDVLLTQDRRILLPADDPKQALEQALAVHLAHDAFDRDITVFDMRLIDRPTLRMGANAHHALKQPALYSNQLDDQ